MSDTSFLVARLLLPALVFINNACYRLIKTMPNDCDRYNPWLVVLIAPSECLHTSALLSFDNAEIISLSR